MPNALSANIRRRNAESLDPAQGGLMTYPSGRKVWRLARGDNFGYFLYFSFFSSSRRCS